MRRDCVDSPGLRRGLRRLQPVYDVVTKAVRCSASEPRIRWRGGSFENGLARPVGKP